MTAASISTVYREGIKSYFVESFDNERHIHSKKVVILTIDEFALKRGIALIKQNFKNHLRYDPAFHFTAIPLMLFIIIVSIINLISAIRHDEVLWLSILMVCSAIGLSLTLIISREYSKKLQDRVIRMEENFRHYRLFGNPLNPKLTLDQIIALRFASDLEFSVLCERAVKENLKPVEIKKAVRNWRDDLLRV